MEDKNSIDLVQAIKKISQYKLPLISIVLVCTVLAMGLAFLLPKQYESKVLIRAKSQKGNAISLQAATALAVLGGGSATNATQSYVEMMKSRSVLEPVIEQSDLPNKDKLDAKAFAVGYLKIQNIKGTELIEVSAIGRTPEEAQQIAGKVVASFQQFLTKMNQSEQSHMVKFLKERINTSKQEMEQAERNLENFRQQEKIYIPDEQSKAAIKKLTEFDQKIAQLQVEVNTSQAKLQGVTEQLSKQNSAITQYNIADNAGIQKLRESIINKQVGLIEKQQRFTDKHPEVIILQKEITELKSRLSEEVNYSVQAQVGMNPVQIVLLKEKVEAETEFLAGQAALGVAQKLQSDNEKQISNLSAASISYIGLERQVKIAQEVYGVLVKNYEQTRIQEAMENMDIQIVDEANLPKQPSAPRKLLITAIGGVIGIILSLVYFVFTYVQSTGKINKFLSKNP